MEVRAKGGKGPLLFEWDPETQTVDLIRKDMYYKVHLDIRMIRNDLHDIIHRTTKRNADFCQHLSSNIVATVQFSNGVMADSRRLFQIFFLHVFIYQ